jgi:hypothetical protein
VGDAIGWTRHGNRRLPLQCLNGGRAAPSRRPLPLHDEPAPRLLWREPDRQPELLDLDEVLLGMAANLHTHIVTTGTINIKSAFQFPALDECFPQTQATAGTHWPRPRYLNGGLDADVLLDLFPVTAEPERNLTATTAPNPTCAAANLTLPGGLHADAALRRKGGPGEAWI